MNGFTRTILDKIPKGKNVLQENITQIGINSQFSEMAKNFAIALQDSSQTKECLVEVLSIDSDLISDDLLNEDAILIDDLSSAVSDISDDTCELVHQYFKDASMALTNNNSFPQIMTITDSIGSIYNVKVYGSPELIDRQQVYISCLHYDGPDTIEIPLLFTSEDEVNHFNNIITDVNGRSNTFYNVAVDMKKSLNLNTLMYDICNDLSNVGDNTFQALSNHIQSAVNSGDQEVSEVANDLMNVLGASGIPGLMSYVTNFIKEQSSNVTSDEDNRLTLTDNTTYIPKIYLSGVIQGVVAVAGTVASVVAAIVSPVLGIAVALISQTASAVVGAMSQAHRDSYANSYDAVNSPEAVNLSFPYGVFQFTDVPASKLASFILEDEEFVVNRDMQKLLLNSNLIYKCQVPGGMVIIGRSPNYAEDNQVFNFEFHPSCRDVFSKLGDMEAWANKIFTILGHPVKYVGDTVGHRRLWFGFTREELTDEKVSEIHSMVHNIIVNYYEKASLLQPNGADEFAGYYVNEVDENVRINILLNSFIFYAWYLDNKLRSMSGFTEYLTSAVCIRTEQSTTIDDTTVWWLNPGYTSDIPNSSEWNYFTFFTHTLICGILKIAPDQHILFDKFYTWSNYNVLAAYYDIPCYDTNDGQVVRTIKAICFCDHGYDTSSRSWTNIGTAIATYGDFTKTWKIVSPSEYQGGLSSRQYELGHYIYPFYDYMTPYSTSKFFIMPPTVNWYASLALFILISVVTVAVGIAASVVTVKVKYKINRIKAKHAAAVNTAYSRFSEDPSDENYKLYNQARFKNNLSARFIGGTIYSKSDYWFDNGTAQDSNGKILNSVLSVYNTNSDQSVSLETIKFLITGHR